MAHNHDELALTEQSTPPVSAPTTRRSTMDSILKGVTIQVKPKKKPDNEILTIELENRRTGELETNPRDESSNSRELDKILNTRCGLSSSWEDPEAERAGEDIPPEDWKPTTKEWLILLTLTTATLVVALDASILVSVLPTLSKDLHGSAIDAFWIGTSYLLVHAVLQPFLTTLSDIFGRREVLLPSILFFFIGSIVCATAHHVATMMVGRVIQGIGGAGVICQSQVVPADIIPLRQRPKYYSIVQMAWGIGILVGPITGGAFVGVSWRWCFWINLPICVLAMVMAILCLKLKTEKSSLRSKLVRMDWIGSFLFVAGLTSALIAITWGGIQFEWKSVQTITPLVMGVLGILLCLWWERYHATEPFLTKALFPNLSAVVSYLCALLHGLSLYLVLYYIPLYFASVRMKSPVAASTSLFPTSAFVIPGSIVVAQLITRLGTFRWAIWIGWTVSTLGAGLFIGFDENTSKAYWASAEAVCGVGLGMILSSINFSIQATVASEDAGRAVAMYAFCRSVGMALGVAIGGTAFQNVMQTKLIELGVESARSIAKNAEVFISTLRSLPEDDGFRIKVLQGYAKGFQASFTVLTAICGLALFLSAFVKHANMDKLFVTKHSSR